MANNITVIEDGIVLYMGYDQEEAWEVYKKANGRDVTYVDNRDARHPYCDKKDYIIVPDKWDEVLFRDDRAAYEYCKRYKLDVEVRKFSFTRDDYGNTKFRCYAEYVKNFRIREDGCCFANTTLNRCRCNWKDTETWF